MKETLRMLKEMGHRLAPAHYHRHHFGEIREKWRALEMVTRAGVETIVLVIISPLGCRDGSDENSKSRGNVQDFGRLPGSSIPLSDSNGLYPACPFLESRDGKRIHRFSA